MTAQRPNLPPLTIPAKNVIIDNQIIGRLSISPSLQPSTPPIERDVSSGTKVGKYLLVKESDAASNLVCYNAVHVDTNEKYVCKSVPIERHHDLLIAYHRCAHENIAELRDVIVDTTRSYLFFDPYRGDLHSYIRQTRRLPEATARALFQQMARAVAQCHANGVVLRDIKLRKFVFKDEAKTQLLLEGLEDAVVLKDDSSDELVDKHGCPAYVGPELLRGCCPYSGRRADMWSMGIVLYTMLVGRYPFHDPDPAVLFAKIRRGHFSVPSSVSSRARCLVMCLLRQDAATRLTAQQVLAHPWFRVKSSGERPDPSDQTVPELDEESSDG